MLCISEDSSMLEFTAVLPLHEIVDIPDLPWYLSDDPHEVVSLSQL